MVSFLAGFKPIELDKSKTTKLALKALADDYIKQMEPVLNKITKEHVGSIPHKIKFAKRYIE